MAANSGSSHSIESGSAPICSGVIKVAVMRLAITDILISTCGRANGLSLAKMSQINSIDNTEEVKQACGTGVYLPDFVWPAVDREAPGGGYVAQKRHHR